MIEAIKFNDEIENYMVIYGEIAEISHIQEVLFLKNYISNDFPTNFFEKNEILEEIIKKITVKNTCKLINYCDETLMAPNELFFDKFLAYAKSFNYLTEEEIAGIQEEKSYFLKENALCIRKENLHFIKEISDAKTQEKSDFQRDLPLISGEKILNLSECENIESIVGSLTSNIKVNSYFAGFNSRTSQGNSLPWGGTSEFDSLGKGWNEKE